MIHKQDRDELLMFPFRKNDIIRVKGIDIQRELQEKDCMERSLIAASKRISELEEKLRLSRSLNESYAMQDQHRYFEVRA